MAITTFTKKIFGFGAKEKPPVSGPAGPTETALFKKPKMGPAQPRKKNIPEGIWTKCPKCHVMIYDKELDDNLKVCAHCRYHFPLGSQERLQTLVAEGSFEEMDASLESVDILKFTGVASYTSKLSAYQKQTGLKDAIVTGVGKIGKRETALAVMDFSFLGGSMGSVVGEKIARLVERAMEKRLPLVIVSTSGGARMYEGMCSLMQMAKTCGALALFAKKRLPYISVLTNPTTAGVMASYASVGDLIVAEPGAMIGFAGPRVIKDTTQSELPSGFQTAEFLLEHGLIDAIVPREQMRDRLGQYLEFMCDGNGGRKRV